MVDASIRKPQVSAEVEKGEKTWTERWLRNEERGKNNDLSCREGGREGVLLWLWQVSQQTFWTLLDSASAVSSGGGEVHTAGTYGGFCRGILEAVMNAGGMLQECRIGPFRGGPLNEGRCGPRGNHRIIIPTTAYLFLSTRMLTHTH